MKHLYILLILCFGLVLAPERLFAQEIIVDNSDPGFSVISGDWKTGSGANKYGADYRFADVGSDPVAVVSWQATLPHPGVYRVDTWYPQGGNRSNNAPFSVHTGTSVKTTNINQQSGGTWVSLGRYDYTGTAAEVRLNNDANPNVVMADAIRFVYDPPRDEYRFLWASRFEWPSASQSTTINNIDEIMETTAEHNFNSIFFQVRGQADTLYPSPDEPWTSTYGWSDPGFDPTAYAVEKAHELGLEFHAYINTHTIAGPIPPANTVPKHLYHLHGPGAPPEAERWDIHNNAGNPPGVTDGYLWMSPGVPNASAWTRKQVRHIMQTYDIDGLHFDRIRTPGDYSYDPVSLARFNGEGNPDRITNFNEFMRDQIRRDMQLIYGEVQYYKPHVTVSAAPFGIMYRDSTTTFQGDGTYAWHNWNQDAFSWLQQHSMDFMVPQIYWEINSQFAHEKLLSDWLAKSGGWWIVNGSRTGKTIGSQGPKSIASLMSEAYESRSQNAAGHCVFSYGALDTVPSGDSMDYWTGFLTGPYDVPTTTPKMPWKLNPTVGFITGYILDENNEPVTDARINLDGVDYNTLSAADGFFSILDVAPGTNHTLRAIKNYSGSLVSSPITVTAGSVTSLTLQLNPNRGFIAFDAPAYDFEDSANMRLYDVDLAGQTTVDINIASSAEPSGETVTLTGSGDGFFTGSIDLYTTTAAVTVDGKLAVYPDSEITATYADANDGSGVSNFIESTAIRSPEPIIIESRFLTGSLTPSPGYEELAGSWSNSGTSGPNSEHTKSLAPGLTGRGVRSSTSGNARVRFTPDLATSGFYDVYVTLPGPVRGGNLVSPGAAWTLTHADGAEAGTLDYSNNNAALGDTWYKLAEGVKLLPGQGYSLEIQNQNPNTSTSQRFAADSVKFVFSAPVPVAVSSFLVE